MIIAWTALVRSVTGDARPGGQGSDASIGELALRPSSDNT